ncbi:MAG: SDR family oxidoreductase [Bacteroidia bacterium]
MNTTTNHEQTVLITGGSSGLGLATAKRFVQAGQKVAITGRNEEKLQAVVAELGPLAKGYILDMADLSGMDAVLDRIEKEWGVIWVLVNNAGINQKKDFLDVTDDDFQRIIQVNQASLFSLSREVVRRMVAHEVRGSIINISSMSAWYGIPKIIAYTASKTAVEGMTRSMAVDLGPLGIRVNCVAPGFIKTPMSDKALNSDPERKNRVLSRTPLGQLGKPEDIGNAVFFLASDQASFIHGEVIKVDGGNSIGF